MNSALRLGWALAVRAANMAASLAARTNTDSPGKLGNALALRAGGRARIAAHRELRDPDRPLLWLHAPSVGEGLQARPILKALRAQFPDCQLAYTYFSPSATPFAHALVADGLADWAEVLPFDGTAEAELLLDCWLPSAIVFVKLDVWPVLCERAAARGVPTALVSATLAANSSRQGGLARALLGDAYRSLGAVGAIAPADAERLIALGAAPEVVQVTGDTRMDQVAARAATVHASHPVHTLLETGSDSPRSAYVLVAGSTWPADEAVLLPAFQDWRGTHQGARLIIAPHEPTDAHLAAIERWARHHQVALARLSTVEHNRDTAWELLLVDRIGVLGDLYGLADRAFVGGGFHSHGLHSVLEPAAFGVPVLFGPQHHNAREADLLVQRGGAHVVQDHASLAARLGQWSESEPTRAAAGRAAHALIAESLGSSERVVSLLARLVPQLGSA